MFKIAIQLAMQCWGDWETSRLQLGSVSLIIFTEQTISASYSIKIQLKMVDVWHTDSRIIAGLNHLGTLSFELLGPEQPNFQQAKPVQHVLLSVLVVVVVCGVCVITKSVTGISSMRLSLRLMSSTKATYLLKHENKTNN